MKKFSCFLLRIRKTLDKKFFLYTGLFFAMMMALYLYMIFAIGTDAPKFTYAGF